MAGKVTAMDIKMLVATLPESANLSAWCRKLGISRQTAHKWRRRFRAEGAAGLTDRSRAPQVVHGRTEPALEDLVVALRKQLAETGLDHGPASIRDRLVADHDLQIADATVWRILTRRGQINPHPAKRPRSSWKRFNRDRPNECWQGDDTHSVLAGGQEVRIINVLDDHSRLNVDSLAVAQCCSPLIWESFCRGVSRWGVPAEFLNDNGRAWISGEGSEPVVFQANLAHLGVHQIHSQPYHPQTCGKVERFHQTQRRWLDAHPQAATIAELQEQLDAFRAIYNEQRPHRGIGRRTPASVWAEKAPATPPRSAREGPTTITSCRAGSNGEIRPARRLRVLLGVEWAGASVTVIRRDDRATVVDAVTAEIIREIHLEPGRISYGNGRPRGGSRQERRYPAANV